MGKVVKALKDKKALKKRMEKETMSSFTVESKDEQIIIVQTNVRCANLTSDTDSTKDRIN
jgi:hypothetical protein